MSKVIEFPFVDGSKEITIGSQVAFTNNNYNRGKTIHTDEVAKIGRSLIHLEGGRSFYIESGHEKADVCGSQIYSSEEAVLYMRKVEKMRLRLSDAFSYGYSKYSHHMSHKKIEECHKIIFKLCDSCEEPLDEHGGCDKCEETDGKN